jgi:5-methylcytosine-specific restriction endonuclease McrA
MTWKAPPRWKAIRKQVFALKGTTCYWCPAPATSVDHLVPQALGGGEELSNLVPACRRCNTLRGASLGGRLLAQRRHGQATWQSARRW